MSTLEEIIAKIKQLSHVDQRRVSALLGAVVTDVASRPLHWIYNQDNLDVIIANKTETEFWPENKCPFFSIPLGDPTAYNDTTRVCLQSIVATGGNLEIKHMGDALKKHFGDGSAYADALSRRKAAYEAAPKGASVGPIEGPWVHKAMLLFLENYEKSGESGEAFVGDAECKENDIFCAALPLIVRHAGAADSWKEALKIVSLFSSNVAATEMTHTLAMLVESAITGSAEPLAETTKQVESIYPDVYELLCEVEEAKQLPYPSTVATFGKACYMPGSFQGGLLALHQASTFVEALRLNISAGGCSGGRGNFIGAYFAARDGIDAIPVDWLKRVKDIEQIMEMAFQLVTLSMSS